MRIKFQEIMFICSGPFTAAPDILYQCQYFHARSRTFTPAGIKTGTFDHFFRVKKHKNHACVTIVYYVK